MGSQSCFSETIDTKRSAGFFDLLACFRMVCEKFANAFPFSHIHMSSGTFEISREHHDDECRHEFCCSAKNGLEISLICKASRNMSLSVEVSRVAGVFKLRFWHRFRFLPGSDPLFLFPRLPHWTSIYRIESGESIHRRFSRCWDVFGFSMH